MATCIAGYTVSGNWRYSLSKYLAQRTSANIHKPLITVTISPAIPNDKGLLSKYRNTIPSNAGVNELVHRRHSHEPRTFENSANPSLVSKKQGQKSIVSPYFALLSSPPQQGSIQMSTPLELKSLSKQVVRMSHQHRILIYTTCYNVLDG